MTSPPRAALPDVVWGHQAPGLRRELPAAARVEMALPRAARWGEGPAARMTGKDFLAKLLSRWIYPGLVLVDSGTFSLLSRFLFMTCHLLQQARREPLASSSRSGCRSGTRRHRCRQPLAPFQEQCQGLAGHPACPFSPLPALPALSTPAGVCWRGGKGQLPLRQEELAAAGWHRRTLCQRYGRGFYNEP